MNKFLAISIGKILPIIIFIGGGIAIANNFMANQQRIMPIQKEKKALLVEVKPLKSSDEQIEIEATGMVIPAQEITIMPELNGKLIHMNKNLEIGGFIKKGELIAEVDKTEYELKVVQLETQVAEAEYNIKIEQGKQEIAKSEWNMLDAKMKSDANKELLLRKPHIERLQATLKYAKKALDDAKLDLEKTKIFAPFNCIVQEKYVEENQMVSQSSKIAYLIGTDKFWVRANVPVSNLKYINLPKANEENGSTVDVFYQMNDGKSIKRPGRIIRYLGDLEQSGQMARLIAEIEDPLGLKNNGEEANTPMFLNSFVNVKVYGAMLKDVVAVKRGYIHEGNKIWLLNTMNQLEIKTIDILWKRTDDVLVSMDYLAGNETVVTSKISTPIQHMQLRTQVNNQNFNPQNGYPNNDGMGNHQNDSGNSRMN